MSASWECWVENDCLDVKTSTYHVEDEHVALQTEQVDYACEDDEENPHSSGLDEDPQDRLRVNKVSIIITRPRK